MRAILSIFIGLVISASASALSLGDLSEKDTAGGLKEALSQGAVNAVLKLGKTDGFLGNPQVKIPLPENLAKVESLMRTFGMGAQADELVTTLNRAAESAVTQAKPLLVDAVKKMSVKDAKDILSGGDDAATQYFRRTTATPLREKFRPVVVKAVGRVGLVPQYNQLAAKAAQFGLPQQSMEDYVTDKALDGLFLMIAEQEKAIRANPLQAAGSLAKKVFGTLMQ